jgi:leucyl-tRNA synthetase
LFAAPPEKDLEWSDQGVDGSYRFLNRLWKLVFENLSLLRSSGPLDPARLGDEARGLRRSVHKTIRKVTEDIEDRFHFNTAIAAVMELVNTIQAFEAKTDPENIPVFKEALESVIRMLSPFVPHFAEEVWERLGHTGGIDCAGWPSYDREAVVDEELLIVAQVNGKLRGKVIVPADADEETIKTRIMAEEKLSAYLEGKTVRKVIYVPGKLVNIVVG